MPISGTERDMVAQSTGLAPITMAPPGYWLHDLPCLFFPAILLTVAMQMATSQGAVTGTTR